LRAGRADDEECVVVIAQVIDEGAEGAGVPETNGEAGGVRRESKHVEGRGGVISETAERATATGAEDIEEGAEAGAERFVLREGFVVGRVTIEEGGEEAFGDGRHAGPENGGGVADLHAVKAGLRAGEEGIERGGVAEGGGLGDG